MKVRDWRSPREGIDLGARHGDPLGPKARSGVMAYDGIPTKVEGIGHSHGGTISAGRRKGEKVAA